MSTQFQAVAPGGHCSNTWALTRGPLLLTFLACFLDLARTSRCRSPPPAAATAGGGAASPPGASNRRLPVTTPTCTRAATVRTYSALTGASPRAKSSAVLGGEAAAAAAAAAAVSGGALAEASMAPGRLNWGRSVRRGSDGGVTSRELGGAQECRVHPPTSDGVCGMWSGGHGAVTCIAVRFRCAAGHAAAAAAAVADVPRACSRAACSHGVLHTIPYSTARDCCQILSAVQGSHVSCRAVWGGATFGSECAGHAGVDRPWYAGELGDAAADSGSVAGAADTRETVACVA